MISPEKQGFVITHESEVSYVLSKYNQDFIYSTTMESLRNRIRFLDQRIPNLVVNLEDNFNLNKQEYNNLPVIDEVRQEVYEQIIKIICDFNRVSFDDTMLEKPDIYLSAMCMYEFFISSFQTNICNFFVSYILKEKTSIYEILRLNDLKKQKDASTIYARKTIKNQKLAVIIAQLDYVINSICSTFDIPLSNYINIVYGNNTIISKHLRAVLTPQTDFFKEFIGGLFNSPFRTILIADIKIKLQQTLINEENSLIDVTQFVK